MTNDVIARLGSDIADVAYKLSLLEEEVAKLNAYVHEIKEESTDD